MTEGFPPGFQWDEVKNQANIAKHGLDFRDAVRVFEKPTLDREDNRVAYGETRTNSLGDLDGQIIANVTHTDRNGEIRLISARQANPAERRAYVEFQRSLEVTARSEASAETPKPTEPLHGAKTAPLSAAPAAEQQQGKTTAQGKPEAPAASVADNRRTLRDATAELSADGRLLLEALSENIDRKMNKLNVEGKAEMKAFAATELVKKERAEGPIVLTAEQRALATAAEPARQQSTQTPQQQPEQARTITPEEPRRTRGR